MPKGYCSQLAIPHTNREGTPIARKDFLQKGAFLKLY
jgi:hypothetical protein